MKKIHFSVIKIRKWAVNLTVILIVGVVAGFAIIAGFNAMPTSAVSGVYYNGDKNSNNVTLMINVYWGTEYLDDMLEILDEKGVKTTFFVGGTWAVLNEDYLIQVIFISLYIIVLVMNLQIMVIIIKIMINLMKKGI